ncbi:rhodanese-related sulfurtransferase [Burkholderiales bacterium JOSHI_001]|nr:rhodanese-related sulfurtransferase [Burkholderiales bacterium JOSHI_001]
MSASADTAPLSAHAVREALRARQEIALIDVREEDPFAQEHPLFAAQLSMSRLELDAPWRLPRRDVPVVVYDDGEGLAEPALRRLRSLGYSRARLLDGGLDGWRRSGGELFRDVNVPSKAFGELVEHHRHTPSLSAPEVKALLDAQADVVVLDARRFDEYQTMSIPGGISVPGAELALRVRDLAPNPATRVIVNCAGRTRSIIGTQSLVNAGIPNPVAALRNGTIGWTLAGQALDHGASRRAGPASAGAQQAARQAAQALAQRAGAHRLTADRLPQLDLPGRTVYRYDVRSPEEFQRGHIAGFGSAPGGQLVQETDVFAPVRGARIVLADDDGVRAPMTAHWLAQMGWDVAWLDAVPPEHFQDTRPWPPQSAPSVLPAAPAIGVAGLQAALARGDTLLIDLAPSATHVKQHIAGAWWALRSQLPAALQRMAQAKDQPPGRVVFTCGDGLLAQHAAADLQAQIDRPVLVLEGGNAAWRDSGGALETGEAHLASPRIDRYRRPYEGTDNPHAAMQAYLDWEFGLVAQLGRDATHGFQVLATQG